MPFGRIEDFDPIVCDAIDRASIRAAALRTTRATDLQEEMLSGEEDYVSPSMVYPTINVKKRAPIHMPMIKFSDY